MERFSGCDRDELADGGAVWDRRSFCIVCQLLFRFFAGGCGAGNLACSRQFLAASSANKRGHKRMEAIEDAFSVSPEHTKGKSRLLFDDLYESLPLRSDR